MSAYNCIAGLEGRDPIGVVLSVGRKDSERGFPVEKDRFHLVMPREEGGVRPAHPAYTGFNGAAPDQRRVMRGNIVHATRTECFEYYRRAQVLDRRAHPDRRPYCEGDGRKATRWTGPGAEDYSQIQCLNDLCPYAKGEPAQCKPFARLLFRLRWREDSKLPCLLAKFTTGSWNTAANLVGFFDYIDETARRLGVQDATLFGFPFVLTLTQQTKPSVKTRFPVVTISPDDVDPIEFFRLQAEHRQALASYRPALLAESTVDENYEDVKSISRGGAMDGPLTEAEKQAALLRERGEV